MLIDDVRWICERVPGRRLPDALGAVWDAAILGQAVVLAVDDVARYLDVTTSYPFALEAREVPNIAPLAPVTWFEWEALRAPEAQSRMGGLLVVVADFGDAAFRATMARTAEGAARLARWDADPNRTRWIYEFWPVTRQGPHLDQVVVFDSFFVVYADRDGGGLTTQFVRGASVRDDDAERSKVGLAHMLHAPLVGLCFAHCKGVTVQEHRQPRQQRRAAERAGRPALVTYKTLDIRPAARVMREYGQAEKTGVTRALHLCRGHFAHYTGDKPLFGKYTGTFYIPLHVRGTAQRGVVAKDYRVLATQEQQRTMAP